MTSGVAEEDLPAKNALFITPKDAAGIAVEAGWVLNIKQIKIATIDFYPPFFSDRSRMASQAAQQCAAP